ncbi:hypothetical protein A2303_01115 [Candidatus Falkowbacteria bacterium RIFOXYB2_FULL_47_14]|uniref:Transcription regulator TrmB N-terminal domain-containing protein n=1 Tax=Candidatus Falkowbacteria bacterium RIFOXYA2_FULL_47_19 TaxID=1797994 RepID=A0A1F5SH96_9BACT|nr:MAG: hypothetical protein A2227_00315 [Candidatus Falkowbacteria bacterium RIFOXYA2_FULL_47_19]OGF35553.1 MAG: hypothetical protein A2468_05960 [Candidatus Falkowbacteria bacterium RIFOXYC2_FULL_46_15]OGF42964.1 MAG: hypothetical protein A2303_01115 [Candidatus Falkowbacteria bacterium RIFOXYB2_FULL_47_14]
MKYDSLSELKRQEISEVLESLGLSGRERAAYLALLEANRPLNLSSLAKLAGWPLTTTKYVAAQLNKGGFAAVTKDRSQKLFSAAEPGELKRIFERKIHDIGGIIPLLNTLKAEEAPSARIKIYDRVRMSDIFHEALKAESKLVYEIVSARDFQEILGEKFHFTRRRLAAGVRLKSLRVEKFEIKKYNKRVHEKELREAKFLPPELFFRSSVMIWDDYTAFFTTKREGLAWVVKSRATTEMMLGFFDLLWSVSRRMETLAE